MAGNPYLINSGTRLKQIRAIQTSAGAGDAGKIPAVDASGRLDTSFMPVGVVPETAVVTASEALSAGDFVNVYDAGGSTFRVRKADASTTGKEAHGFVLSSVLITASATVYFEGSNTQVSGVTPGELYLSPTTPGGFTATEPTTAGQISQLIGQGVSTTSIVFEAQVPVELA